MPEVKAFLREGHVEEYQEVSVTWIPGHNPELHILSDEGELVEKVNLKDYTTDGLHELMEEKGFVKKPVSERRSVSANDVEEGNGDQPKRPWD